MPEFTLCGAAFGRVFPGDHERARGSGDPDSHGLRPLSLGKLGNTWVLASESCAFDLIEATFVRDLEPGEFLHITPHGTKSYFPLPSALPAQCIFEYVSFARPDSLLFGQSVASVRKALGRQLAEEAPADADLVIPVPDSGVPAALGFAAHSGIPFDHGLIRNHYVGRTFIEPKQNIRHFGVKIKLNPVRDILEGKRVVVVDDSIVRGTTSRKIVSMVRSAGAREVLVKSPLLMILDEPGDGLDYASRRRVLEFIEFIGSQTATDLIYVTHHKDELPVCITYTPWSWRTEKSWPWARRKK